jgi:arylesterase/paraoxonase
VGAEDMVADRDSGWVFLSSTDRRKVWNEGKTVRGEIFALNSDDLDGPFIPVTRGQPPAFEPHGIDLWVSPDGVQKRLFVVSHVPGGADRIEIFDLEMIEGQPLLIHRETVSDPKIRTANDILAVGERSFYITNDHRYKPGIMRILEDYLLLSLSDVIYFDGVEAKKAAGGLTYPNGIAMNADGTEVYVAETTDGMLRLYRRDPKTGALTNDGLRRSRIRAGTGLDNITVDREGRILIGAHPRLLDFVAHSKDEGALSPTRALRMTLNFEAGEAEIEDLYIGSGEQLSGGTVALPIAGSMLLGSVFEEKILICDLPN